MSYLNGKWFENDIEMHGKRGDICIESGYEKELLFARHCPPDGVYWVATSSCHQSLNLHKWHLVQVTTRHIGALRCFRWLWNGEEHNQDWYDFSQADWRGPVEMPIAPSDNPIGLMVRR